MRSKGAVLGLTRKMLWDPSFREVRRYPETLIGGVICGFAVIHGPPQEASSRGFHPRNHIHRPHRRINGVTATVH